MFDKHLLWKGLQDFISAEQCEGKYLVLFFKHFFLEIPKIVFKIASLFASLQHLQKF
jgi:hypothetical protein